MNSTQRFPHNSGASNAALSRSLANRQQQLEQIWKASPAFRSKPPAPWYQRLGQWLLLSLTDSQQIRVWTKITPQGTQWNAYNPATKISFAGYSENELRTWLEQRHQR